MVHDPTTAGEPASISIHLAESRRLLTQLSNLYAEPLVSPPLLYRVPVSNQYPASRRQSYNSHATSATGLGYSRSPMYPYSGSSLLETTRCSG